MRALLSLSQTNSLPLLPTAKPFHAPEQREGNQKERLAAAELQYENRRRAEGPCARKGNFFTASLPRSAKSGLGGSGAGRVVTGAHPLASRAPVARDHVTITGLPARGGAHEKVELRL